MNQFFFILTNENNFLIRAITSENKTVCFFMSSSTGEHLNKKRDFFDENHYNNLKTHWKRAEAELEDEYWTQAEEILKTHAEIQSRLNHKTSGNNALAEALKKAGIA